MCEEDSTESLYGCTWSYSIEYALFAEEVGVLWATMDNHSFLDCITMPPILSILILQIFIYYFIIYRSDMIAL